MLRIASAAYIVLLFRLKAEQSRPQALPWSRSVLAIDATPSPSRRASLGLLQAGFIIKQGLHVDWRQASCMRSSDLVICKADYATAWLASFLVWRCLLTTSSNVSTCQLSLSLIIVICRPTRPVNFSTSRFCGACIWTLL